MNETLNKALEKIHSARADISSEIESIAVEIVRLEQETRSLPKQTASFSEIKKGILELVVAAGERHAGAQIRASIIDFAKGAYRDIGSLEKYGTPLTLGELDAAIKGELFPMANTRFLSGGVGKADDLMLYAVLSDAVRETLARQMDKLTPADLGMKGAEPEMSRDEMNERIAANLARIADLKERKAVLESELKKLS